MSSYHLTLVVGNVGAKPESIAQAGSDKQACRFPVAVHEKWDGGEHTEWYQVTVNGPAAQVCMDRLDKGMVVVVEGTNRTTKKEEKKFTNLRARVVKIVRNNGTNEQLGTSDGTYTTSPF